MEDKIKEYEDFVNEQTRILREHVDRFNLRCHNKYVKLFFPKIKLEDIGK